MVIGSFAIVALVGPGSDGTHDISTFRGLSRRRPLLAFTFTVFLLAQAGVPLTSGFFAKFYVIEAAVDAKSYALGVIAMPVAESELVAGYLTEYSGFRFLLFFIGEFAAAGAFAALAATMFLGGWAVPFISIDNNAMNLIGPLVLFTKMMIIAFVFFWVRFTYPRFREDQLQRFAWKFLIPIALANIMITACLKVAF